MSYGMLRRDISRRFIIIIIIIIIITTTTPHYTTLRQEAQLSPRDRAMRRLS